MYSQTEEDRRPYPAGRHRAPEDRPAPVAPPAWANEHARPIPALVGERPTEKIRYPSWVATEPPRPLPARAKDAALDALRSPEPKPKATLLGRCLRALREQVGL